VLGAQATGRSRRRAVFQKRTLFERLRSPNELDSHTLQEDTNGLVQSILRNLTRILNARSGQAPAQMDYGIPSPSEVAHAYPESLSSVQKNIRMCIERYEPRLRDVQVMQIESDQHRLAVRFQITARLATSKSGQQVSFSTRLNPAGHVNLQA
jgi:type VI secretion system protein